MLLTARHALPRSRAAVLPTLLIATAGTALAGMAVLPGPAVADSDGQQEPAPVAAPFSPTDEAQAAAMAQAVAREHLDERASRDRRPVVAPETPTAAPVPPPPQFVRPGTGRLTSRYGPRWGRMHAGIDLAAGTGAPVSAVAAGTVLSAGVEGAYGKVVRVQHDAATTTLYAHLSEVVVTPGQRVTAGTYVGHEGSSGRSTGPHLHFEVRIGGTAVDPEPWLRERGIELAAP